MATEEEGPVLDLRALRRMMFDETELSRLARGTYIFVYIGDFEDPTTLSELHFGQFLGYDAKLREVHYRPITDPAQLTTPLSSVRAMITDEVTGLLLPADTRTPPTEEKRVRLDESYIILDGMPYAAYITDPTRQQPGDQLY